MCATLAVFLSHSALAVDAVYTGFFSDVAISGYDAVAYFTEAKPVKGKDQFVYQYQGATWKFSSANNLSLFKAMPYNYAPQYGGYCAWAMATGDIASAEPDQWTIYEGKLYLNYSRKINARWKENMQEFIRHADLHWPNMIKEID